MNRVLLFLLKKLIFVLMSNAKYSLCLEQVPEVLTGGAEVDLVGLDQDEFFAAESNQFFFSRK